MSEKIQVVEQLVGHVCAHHDDLTKDGDDREARLRKLELEWAENKIKLFERMDATCRKLDDLIKLLSSTLKVGVGVIGSILTLSVGFILWYIQSLGQVIPRTPTTTSTVDTAIYITKLLIG